MAFKTPYPDKTPKSTRHQPKFYTPIPSNSDSDESVASGSEGVNSEASSDTDLPLITEYDEIIRCYKSFKAEYIITENSYMQFMNNTKKFFQAFGKTREQCLKQQERLDKMVQDKNDLEGMLTLARNLLDMEKKSKRKVEKERDELEHRVQQMRELLHDNRVPCPDNMFKDLPFLLNNRLDQEQAPLSCILEGNSTGSGILSEGDYSKSIDDLDTSKLNAAIRWNEHRPNGEEAPSQPANKKRRSSYNRVVDINTSDTVRATTTLSMPKNGPITATSVIEAIPGPSAEGGYSVSNKYPPSAPPQDVAESTVESRNNIQSQSTLPSDMILQSWARHGSPAKPARSNAGKVDNRWANNNNNNNNNNVYPKKHQFIRKTLVIPYNCSVCQKKMKFGRIYCKCKDCKNECHDECKDKMPLPCVPVIHTPNHGNNGLGVIGDYCGTIPPMVPAIIIHCVNEIESRRSNEVGLYRVPGSEREVKTLKERFLKGKAAPNLTDVDIHVLCGVVKDFLRSLQEPLITRAFWKDFVLAADQKNQTAIEEKISKLPQPNRDTLAYIMLHLQKISEKKEIMMPVQNLAIVFGPTIVGYLTEDLDPKRSREAFYLESKQQINVMSFLLNLPADYWESFIKVTRGGGMGLQQTPSVDSLLSAMTPSRCAPRSKRFFPTPPGHRY